MAIVRENLVIGNKNFIKQYSDKGQYLQKVGTEEIYSEAIDLEEYVCEYVETDKKVSEE